MNSDYFNLTWLAPGPNASQSQRLQQEMNNIGVGDFASRYMSNKGDFYVLRAENLRAAAANILKQEFLSKGADAAVHSQVILNRPERSSVLMMATAAQYARICLGLRRQQFDLPILAGEIAQALVNIRREVWDLPLSSVKGRSLHLSTDTQIMGILNLTPDSFSDGGNYADEEQAVARALQMQKEGAYIIDVGGESTRPGHQQISADEEISRVVPVIQRLRAESDVLISIDTYKAPVAAAALAAGADIINDIWGLQYPEDNEHQMAALAAAQGCPVIVMHNRIVQQCKNKEDEPAMAQELPRFFRQARRIARAASMKDEQLILDIGFGFGKNAEQNMQALAQTSALRVLGRPILIAASRKSTLGLLTGKPVEQRLVATAATTAAAALAGAALVRVHDVAEAADVLAVCRPMYQINCGQNLNS